MEKISWANHMKNEVLRRVKGKRNMLQTVKGRKASLIGNILCRNCHVKHVVGGKINVRIEYFFWNQL